MFGHRSDGRKLKTVPPFFRVIPNVMLDRSDAQVYFKQDIILKDMDAYIDKKAEEGIKLSIRSSGVYDAGRISNSALKNVGNGGGHEHMAGGFISYAKLDNKDKAYIRSIIEDKFLKQLSVL